MLPRTTSPSIPKQLDKPEGKVTTLLTEMTSVAAEETVKRDPLLIFEVD